MMALEPGSKMGVKNLWDILDSCKKTLPLHHLQRVVEEVVNAFGRIDVLINNATEQYEASSMEEIGEDRLERVFRTHIFSYFFMVRHCVKQMREGSIIINTTSVTAYKGSPTLVDHSSTKGAIVAFTRSLALQLVERGIRVNGVAPGPI